MSSGWWGVEKYLVRLGEGGGGHKNFVDSNENALDPHPHPPHLIINDSSLTYVSGGDCPIGQEEIPLVFIALYRAIM